MTDLGYRPRRSRKGSLNACTSREARVQTDSFFIAQPQ